MKIRDRANELFTKYLDGTCSPSEWEELQVLVAGMAADDAETLTEPLFHLWEQARNQELPSTAHLLDKAKMYDAIIRDREAAVPDIPVKGTSFPDRTGLIRRLGGWGVAAAAAACLLVTGSIWYFKWQTKATAPVQDAAAVFPLVRPGINKAVLTLSGGRQIILDSAISGTISKQGNTTVINTNGLLAYKPDKGQSGAGPLFNTVSTGRANQYELILPDGSKVWLNAMSSIRFPTAFSGADRAVEVTGESYFDVARNATKPFHVKAGAADIEVLGTEFNINAYGDEPVLKASLLAGSVRITSLGQGGVMKPGEEGSLSGPGELQIMPGNVALAAAWKNGYFQFDKAPLPVVMRQIGRWYDLDIRYTGPVPDRVFKGKLQRSLPLSGILQMLQAEDILFRLEGRVLTVGAAAN